MRNDVEAPVKAGDVVGKLEIYVAEDLVNEVDLVVQEDVETGWFPSYLGISNMATIIIGVALVIFLILNMWLSAVRRRNQRRKKLERQRKIRELAAAELEAERSREERDWRF